MNIAQLLSERVATCGEQIAIIDNSRGKNRTFTFAQLELAASRIAAQLHAAGLSRGDAIVLLQPVSAELYILFVALLRCGLVAVFIDPSAGHEHVDRCCAAQSPRAFIGCARAHLLRLKSPALRRIPLKFATDFFVPGVRRLNHQNEVATRSVIEDCSDDFPAIVRFTSGSTGQPKSSVRRHGFLLAQQRVLERSFTLTAGETDLVTMPMFVLSNLAAGVTSLLPHADLRSPGAIRPEVLLREIENHRPQRIGASPALLENLADFCITNSHKLDCFEKIFTGGAPVFPRLLEKLSLVAPAADVVAVYGSTEAEPIALLHQRDISVDDRQKMASGRGLLAGFPDAATQVRILSEDITSAGGQLTENQFESASLPQGHAGQIVVAGPHVQPSHANHQADQGTRLNVGGTVWHQTGDAGYFDNGGRLWLLGRSSARIVDTKGILYPFQVECVALENPEVRRAALLSVKGRRILVLEAGGGLDLTILKRQLDWAAIDTFHLMSKIPVDKRHNAKIDYLTLQSILRDT